MAVPSGAFDVTSEMRNSMPAFSLISRKGSMPAGTSEYQTRSTSIDTTHSWAGKSAAPTASRCGTVGSPPTARRSVSLSFTEPSASKVFAER